MNFKRDEDGFIIDNPLIPGNGPDGERHGELFDENPLIVTDDDGQEIIKDNPIAGDEVYDG